MAEETEERMVLLTAKEAARYLRVSMFTLRKIEKEGGLVPYRTPGGHRRYSIKMLNEYLDKSRKLPKEGKKIEIMRATMLPTERL